MLSPGQVRGQPLGGRFCFCLSNTRGREPPSFLKEGGAASREEPPGTQHAGLVQNPASPIQRGNLPSPPLPRSQSPGRGNHQGLTVCGAQNPRGAALYYLYVTDNQEGGLLTCPELDRTIRLSFFRVFFFVCSNSVFIPCCTECRYTL